MNNIAIFSGNANPYLAEKICDFIGVPLGKALVNTFSDGETRVEIESNVRGKDCFIIQPTCAPCNHNLMELLIMIDALRRASAQRITAVIPYYGYGRQERKSAPRTPITARLVADMLECAGITRVLTLELHTGALQGFFNVPVDHLFTKQIFFDAITALGFKDPVIVSPDAGGVERARALAKVLNCGLAIVDKRRDRPGVVSKLMNVIGDVKGKTAILVDDICDTAGTLTQAANVLGENGAFEVYAAVTHGVFSGPAISRIMDSCLKKIFVTNTIPLSKESQNCAQIEVLCVADLFAKAIHRIHNCDSISTLFV
ncbi:MAG: ribose-phosphate pyrophosphokinase [Silvanigrellaceae bacterium]|nr:ribose-phosphate pyrophosphokinase [Silvanigrellaceae bacterium]